MAEKNIIGIDFDNTIVCYDHVFDGTVREKFSIPASVPADKEAIRNYLRSEGGEDDWIRLQGYIYGEGIRLCRPFPGVLDFLRSCRQKGVKALIISHKTPRPFKGPAHNLPEAARNWLRANGFYETADTGINPAEVNFVPTKQEKIELIAANKCDFFIDDLPEFLLEPGFPERTQRILFDPHNTGRPDARYQKAISWEQVGNIIFNR
ncbi:MAG: hypothetical protein A2285_04085 [Elusimicrobia bacterium RIFOXYA12_FULL_57_11]|nr:MAG: hypothetical protein A2285_04085 [Elusimicrobia bacterium RIFOXYA12_FULL_57_11]